MRELWERLPSSMRGTIRTVITIAANGGVAAIGAELIDPEHFGFAHLKHVAIVFGMGAAAAVINWLRQSPWKTPDDRLMATIARSVPMVMIATLLGLAWLTMPGCGPKQYHGAVVANTTLAQSIFALQDAEIAAHNAKLIPDDKHVVYKKQILALLVVGDDLTLALKAWDQAQPAPANVSLALSQVSKLLGDLQINSPQAEQVILAVQTVLNVLRVSGVLPDDLIEQVFDSGLHVFRLHPIAKPFIVGQLHTAVVVGEEARNVGDDLLDARIVVRHAPILLPEVA